MDRCPNCRARDPGQTQCRRCGMELSPLTAVEDAINSNGFNAQADASSSNPNLGRISITNDNDVNPDDFIVWGFEKLLHHRIPLYEDIARRYGYAVEMADIPTIRDEQDFLALLARAISQKQ